MFLKNNFVENNTDQEKILKLFKHEYVKHVNFFYKKNQITLIYIFNAKLFSFKKYYNPLVI